MHKSKREVMLYAFIDCRVTDDENGDVNIQSQSRKRPKMSDEAPSKQRDGYTKTITQVETIMSKLKEKHDSQYDTERQAYFL